MRNTRTLLIIAAIMALPQVASAGLFGGFASDGRYQRGTDDVCKPVRQKLDASSCETPSSSSLREMKFEKGALQTGANKKVVVNKTSTRLEVRLIDGEHPVFVWDSGQVLGNIGEVYLDPTQHWVAVEFVTRFGGRRVDDLVVMPLGDALSATPVEVPHDAPLAPKNEETDPESIKVLLRSGTKWAKRRKHAKAIADFEMILKEQQEHPEALYRLALSLQQTKKTPEAIKMLQRIVKSKHSASSRWRVEARFAKVFKKLRANAEFRSAVGINRAPGEVVSVYERLVSLGGKWEQAAIPCEEPLVSLVLQRNTKRRFDLVFRSKCRGQVETTRLDGSWRAAGSNELHLQFPNLDVKADDLVCRLERCTDDSGEDCLRCQPEPDLEFLLRVIRR